MRVSVLVCSFSYVLSGTAVTTCQMAVITTCHFVSPCTSCSVQWGPETRAVKGPESCVLWASKQPYIVT